MGLLTAEHEEVRRSVRKFTEGEVLPIADEYYQEEKEIPEGLLKALGKLGYFGLVFPPEYGGSGMDYVSLALVAEELSRGWLSVGSVMTRNLITGALLLAHGTE
ncbi:MAG: acyl-CoA dehydrogenase family protein, partial [bacterium]